MLAVLIVAQVLALWTVVWLVTLALLLIQLESSAPAVFFLKFNHEIINTHNGRGFPDFSYLACWVSRNFDHLRVPRQLEDLLLPVENLLDVAGSASCICRWFIRHFHTFFSRLIKNLKLRPKSDDWRRQICNWHNKQLTSDSLAALTHISAPGDLHFWRIIKEKE